MTKQVAVNTFEGGLMMDMNPLTVKPNVLSDALNATIVTMDGDDYVLLNDMGNGRVESAYLPSGYVPVGIVSYGGIIYVASCNPLTGKGLIGSFPSPQRNVNNFKDNTNTSVIIKADDFFTGNKISSLITKKILFDGEIIRPGDLYGLYGSYSGYNANQNYSYNPFSFLVSYKLAVLDSSGNLRYVDDTPETLANASTTNTPTTDTLVNNYRTAINLDNYHSFNSKIAGLVYLVGILNTILYCNVDVTNVVVNKDDKAKYDLTFQVDMYYLCPEANLEGFNYTITSVEGPESYNYISEDIAKTVVYTTDLKHIVTTLTISGLTPKDNLIEYSFTPTMLYVSENSTNTTPIKIPLNNLTVKGRINTSYIGTGEFTYTLASEYTTDYIGILFDYTNYPEFNYHTEDITLQVVDIATFKEEQKFENLNWKSIYIFPNSNSYESSLTVYINYTDDFNKNRIYLARIIHYKVNGSTKTLVTPNAADSLCLVTWNDINNSGYVPLQNITNLSNIVKPNLKIDLYASLTALKTSTINDVNSVKLITTDIPNTDTTYSVHKDTIVSGSLNISQEIKLDDDRLFTIDTGNASISSSTSIDKVNKFLNLEGNVTDSTSTLEAISELPTNKLIGTDKNYYGTTEVVNGTTVNYSVQIPSMFTGKYKANSFVAKTVYQPFIKQYNWADLFGYDYSTEKIKALTPVAYRRIREGAQDIDRVCLIPATVSLTDYTKTSMLNITSTGESGGSYAVFYLSRQYGSGSKFQVNASEFLSDFIKVLKADGYELDNLIIQLYGGFQNIYDKGTYDYSAYRTYLTNDGQHDNDYALYKSNLTLVSDYNGQADTVNGTRAPYWTMLLWRYNDDIYIIDSSIYTSHNERELNGLTSDISTTSSTLAKVANQIVYENLKNVYIPSGTDVSVSGYSLNSDNSYDKDSTCDITLKISSSINDLDKIVLQYDGTNYSDIITNIKNALSITLPNITFSGTNSIENTVDIKSAIYGLEDVASSIASSTISIACVIKNDEGKVINTLIQDGGGKDLQLGKIYQYSEDYKSLSEVLFNNLKLRNNTLVPSGGLVDTDIYRVMCRTADGDGYFTSFILDLPVINLRIKL